MAEALNLHLLRSLFLHFEVESNDTIDHDKAKIYVLSLSSFSLISMENEVDSLAECCNRFGFSFLRVPYMQFVVCVFIITSLCACDYIFVCFDA